MSYILTIVIIGVVIFVHELGHFLAAWRVGIPIRIFSLGFGPKLKNISAVFTPASAARHGYLVPVDRLYALYHGAGCGPAVCLIASEE
ncbi:MAG: hypothetical protein EHM45_00965 [Desulfobacteraceae bacterium]|nr:MAG: hypothetical protein EHM45_00965 [Desulfobacteraceae bacterium]